MNPVWYDLFMSLLGSCFFVTSLVWCVDGYCMRRCEKRRIERIPELFVEPRYELEFNVPEFNVPESKAGCEEYLDCESVTSF